MNKIKNIYLSYWFSELEENPASKVFKLEEEIKSIMNEPIMYNEDNKFTRLTLEQSDKKIVWEVPYEDVDAIDDMLHAIYTIMVGMTFHPDTVIHAFASFLQEKASNLYDIYEHEENQEDEEEDK